MKLIFDQIQYDDVAYDLYSKDIKQLLELKHDILEENENYIHYVIKQSDTDVYFIDFNIVYIKNTDFDFRTEKKRLFLSLVRISEGLFNEYYIKSNSRPEHVIKKLVKERPSIGLPLLTLYSNLLLENFHIKKSDLIKFNKSLSLLLDYFKQNNIQYDKYDIDIKKLETLPEIELTQYIDSLNIPEAKKLKQYCDLDFLPLLINEDYCIVDYSSRSFYKIVQNEDNFKIYLINLDYPIVNVSEDLSDIVNEFLHYTGQNLHLLVDKIGVEHLIFESLNDNIKFITHSMSDFENIHSFVFKKIKSKLK